MGTKHIACNWILLGILIWLSRTSYTRAATYYVDDVNGADSYNAAQAEEIATPWKTISNAQRNASAGDTIHIRSGIYYEQIILSNYGSWDNWITYEKYPFDTDKPVIDGTLPISEWTQCAADDPCLVVTSINHPQATRIYWAYCNVANFPTTLRFTQLYEGPDAQAICSDPNTSEPFGDDPKEFQSITGGDGETAFFEDSARMQGDGFWNGAWVHVYLQAQNATVQRTECLDFDAVHDRIYMKTERSYAVQTAKDSYRFVNHPHILDGAGEFYIGPVEEVGGVGKRKIFYWPRSRDTFSTRMRIAARNYGFYRANYPNPMYLKFKNLKVRGIGTIGMEFQGRYAIHGSYLTIENVDVDGTGSHGIEAQFMDDVNIVDCNVTRCMSMGIHLDGGNDNLVRNCTVSKTVGTNIKLGDQNDVVALGNECWGIHGGHGNGMSIYGSWEEDANHLWIDYSQNACIAKNLFHNCNASANYAKNLYFFGNLFDIDPHGGIVLAIEPHSSTYSGKMVVLNNTLLSNYTGYTMICYVWDPDIDQVDNYLYNNVIYRLSHQWDYNDYSWTRLPNGEKVRTSVASPAHGWNVNGEHAKCTVTRSHNSYTGYLFTQSIRENWILGAGSRDNRATNPAIMFVDPTYRTGDYTPLTGGPLDSAGTDVAAIVAVHGMAVLFPEVDFTTDLVGNAWNTPPSIGAYAGSGVSDDP